MIVMKFGGTSIEDAPSIERVVGIIRARIYCGPVVVVSAMGKTTRRLLEAAEASAAGDSNATLQIVADLKTRHMEEARGIEIDGPLNEVFSLIDRYFDEMRKLLEGLAILGEVPPRGLDKILAYGELLSSAILAGAMKESGLPSELFDSRELVKTDEKFGAATPLFDLTDPAVRERVIPAVERGIIPVLQGYIGSTRTGATTTLGFEGSDLTATIIGAAIDADDIQIWKDVSGLMTADPAVFPDAYTVKSCSFAEAAELTFCGAKILHPKAVYPAARKNIPVHIYNSRIPDATGTEISAKAPVCRNHIKSIAFKKPVAVLQVSTDNFDGSHVLPPSEFASKLIEMINRTNMTAYVTALTASSAAVVFDTSALDSACEYFTSEFGEIGRISVERQAAMISLVGEGLKRDKLIPSLVLKALDCFDIRVILHGASRIALNIVIGEKDVEKTIASLHPVFFSDPDPLVFE